MPENNANVYVSAANNIGMRASEYNTNEHDVSGVQHEYENKYDASGSARRTPDDRSAGQPRRKPIQLRKRDVPRTQRPCNYVSCDKLHNHDDDGPVVHVSRAR